MTPEEKSREVYPLIHCDDWDKEQELVAQQLDRRVAFVCGYEQALKDIGIVNELMAQQGIAVVEHLENHAGYQLINTLLFVGEDEDKPRPMPCKYYHVWIQPAKEEEL